MTNFDMLIAAIAGAPALHGSRCRGKSHLFDGAEPGENPTTVAARHAQALGLCSHCPALDRCETWFLSLKPSKRPPGVVRGGSNQQPTRKADRVRQDDRRAGAAAHARPDQPPGSAALPPRTRCAPRRRRHPHRRHRALPSTQRYTRAPHRRRGNTMTARTHRITP